MAQWKLYFTYEDKYNDVELWDYDGSKFTEITAGMSTNAGGLHPNYLDVYNGKLLFTGDNAAGTPELWISNGTKSGTKEIKPIRGAFPGGLYPSYLTTYKTSLVNEVLFDGESGNDVETTHTLWVTKGNSASTAQLGGTDNHLIKNVNKTLGLLVYFQGFTRFEGVEYFAGQDANNQTGLWRTNGTIKGTYEITPIKGAFKNAPAGTIGTDIFPTSICVVGAKMFFAGQDLQDGQAGLWVMPNGTGKGIYEVGGQADKGVKNSPAGNASNLPHGMGPIDITAYHGKAIFDASDNTTNPDTGFYRPAQGLWVSNGSASGTVELGGHGSSQIANAAKAAYGGLEGGVNPDYTVFNNKVLFLGADDKDSGLGGPPHEELWITNGSVAGTHEIGGLSNAGIKQHPIFGSGGSSDSPDFTVYGGKVFFTAQAYDSAAGSDEWAIWTTDGTASGTHMVPNSFSNDYLNTDFKVGKL